MPDTSYLLDNTDPNTRVRFDCLNELYNPITFGQFDAIGVGPGWGCLEVGAGDGVVARELAGRVYPAGSVTATDIDTRWMGGEQPDNLTVLRHNMTTDPLPVGTYDLIHARLVIMHLPNPNGVVQRLTGALRPGGWLVVEELDPLLPYIPHATTDTDRLINRVGNAFTASLEERGADNTRGCQAHRTLTTAGLVNVINRGHIMHGGPKSAVAKLMYANATQTRRELVATGLVTNKDVDSYLAALTDPDTTLFMPIFYTAAGQRQKVNP